MSMWIFFEPGEKALSRPVTRSSKREPTAIIRSQSCIAIFASYVPCMPTMPRKCGSLAGNAPSPIRVSVHGASTDRTNSVKRAQASGPELISPPPP